MKKWIVVVAVLLILLIAAPWGIGKIAESRVDRGVEQLVEVAPYLRIADRKYTPGWFRSEQEVTFEVVGPWSRAMGPNAALEALGSARRGDDIRGVQPGESAIAVMPDTPPATQPGEERLQPDMAQPDMAQPAPDSQLPMPGSAAPEPAPSEPPALASPPSPLRFTIRNEILHGPVLWTSGLGIARVNTRIVVPEKVRQSLIDTFGTDEPLRISTKLGFFGGRTTTFSGDERKVSLKDGGEISWDKLNVEVMYPHDLDYFDIVGDWPRFEFRDKDGANSGVFEDMTIEGSSERVAGDLYDGDVEFRIGKLSIKQPSGGFDARDAYYLVDSSLDGDFMSVKFGFGTGEVSGNAVAMFGSKVEEMHYDFAVRRLHTKTLERLMTAIKESYSKAPAPGVSAEIAAIEPIKAQTFELFKHDPELIIEKLGLTTVDGEAYFKGTIRFRGVTEEDLAIGGLGLIGKIDAELEFSGHRKLVEKAPGGVTSVGELIDGGYVVREGDKLVSKIAFRGGVLTINGKPQGIPGLGPPPGALGPEGMPPRE